MTAKHLFQDILYVVLVCVIGGGLLYWAIVG